MTDEERDDRHYRRSCLDEAIKALVPTPGLTSERVLDMAKAYYDWITNGSTI